MSSTSLLEVEGLTKQFTTIDKSGNILQIKALNRVSFCISRGETLGLVGESGCGKTTLARTVLRLIEPDYGSLYYDGADITHTRMTPYRKKMQIVFQNSANSFNPRHRISDIIAEGLRVHRIVSASECDDRVAALLESVGLEPGCAKGYPHEFSGGQQQRIGIARALAVEPEFIVCDEPVSSLDVSYQSQIINLLTRLQVEKRLTYLFISHELPIVRYISDRIGVMYRGRIVELSDSESIVHNPCHPYTKALLDAIPEIAHSKEYQNRCLQPCYQVNNEPSDTGCCYHHICPYIINDTCCYDVPELTEVASHHYCACHAFSKTS